MALTKQYSKLKKDHTKWLADHKKWKKNHQRVSLALQKLAKMIKQHDNDIKSFETRVKSQKSVMGNKARSKSVYNKLKKAHYKQNQHHALHSKARNNILKLTKSIENTVRHFNIG